MEYGEIANKASICFVLSQWDNPFSKIILLNQYQEIGFNLKWDDWLVKSSMILLLNLNRPEFGEILESWFYFSSWTENKNIAVKDSAAFYIELHLSWGLEKQQNITD